MAQSYEKLGANKAGYTPLPKKNLKTHVDSRRHTVFVNRENELHKNKNSKYERLLLNDG